MGEYNTQAKLDFVYVGVSAGVTEDFGNDDKQYLKTFDYNVDPKTIKDSTKDKIKIGYYHYLTGYPSTNGKSPEEIGKNQANKFLEKLGYDKDGKLKDSKILDGTLIPMVIFNDNITQKNYYGGSPRDVKENLNNF
jgi:hypothetical protein